MLHSLRQLSTNFLARRSATAIVVWLVATVLMIIQPQPWSIPERGILAIPPAFGPALLAAFLQPFGGPLKQNKFLPVGTLLLWILLLADIGLPFLSWFLVFVAVAILLYFVAPGFHRALAVGMLLFAGFYLTLRLHQAEQLGWLHLRVALEERSESSRFKADLAEDTIRILVDNRAVFQAKKPLNLSPKVAGKEEAFSGLNPLLILSANPADERAIPLVALLSVPRGFPPKLWNIQLESTLAGFRREGRIGEVKSLERAAKCGTLDCRESLWVYEDRFQARSVQTGYALVQTNGGDAPLIMIWFREPFVEGLPHSPSVLDLIKSLAPIEAEGKAN